MQEDFVESPGIAVVLRGDSQVNEFGLLFPESHGVFVGMANFLHVMGTSVFGGRGLHPAHKVVMEIAKDIPVGDELDQEQRVLDQVDELPKPGVGAGRAGIVLGEGPGPMDAEGDQLTGLFSD